MRRNRIHGQEDAVSPVVGVMLMLVVVIIIAAVVSAFAGGLTSKEEKAPVAILDVDINSLENAGGMPPWGNGYYTPTMTIRHVSGDPLPTKDLKIITYFQNKTNSKAVGTLQGEVSVAGNAAWNFYTASQYCGVFFINDPKQYGTGAVQDSKGRENWFGNASAILRPGDILTTPAQFCGNYDDNHGPSAPHVNTGMNYLFGFNVSDPANGFRSGSVAEVKVLHIPSGKYIYDQKVVLA
jgi:archaeal type IV pilus assembly protein PilA